MSKIFLIHGTSVGVKYSVFRGSCVTDGSFRAFGDLIDSGDVYLCRWFDKAQDWSFWKSLNPLSTIKLYQYERKQIQTKEKIAQLKKEIESQQPTIIIAHSLGCHYLVNYINTYDLPESINLIYLINSEAPKDLELTNPSLIKKLQDKTLVIKNYFFGWDFTLLSSTLITGKICSGVVGFDSPYISNHYKFIPTLGNWHTSLLESRWIKEAVVSENILTIH